jgi:GNAT superfamily N-acetyltransferase
MQEPIGPITIERLGTADASEIEQLFFAVEQRVEPGFLARRAPGYYKRILCEEKAAAVGAKIGGALIGYSVSYRVRENPYPEVKFLHEIDATRSIVYKGVGTVILPGYEGRLLARRLLIALEKWMLECGMNHFLGLTAIGNSLGFGNILRAGGYLVGLASDEVSLNYVAYTGSLKRAFVPVDKSLVDWNAVDEHKTFFDDGYVVTGIEKPDPSVRRKRSRHFVFARQGAINR